MINKKTLALTDFNNVDKTVEVVGEISGIDSQALELLTASQKSSIEKYILDEKLIIKRKQSTPSSAREVKLEVKDPETGDWNPNPTGIDNALKKILPEPIVISAMGDSEEDVTKNKTTTTIGKLISEITKPIEEAYKDDLNKTLGDLKKKLSFDGENRAEELEDFDKVINEKLNDTFPDLKVKLDVSLPSFSDIFKTSTLKVMEGEEIRNIGMLGSGSVRAIQMSLIRQLADIKKGKHELSRTLLMIDEPELYLHPFAIEQLRIALKLLAEEGYQIIFTTHSPLLIKRNDIHNTLIIRKCSTEGTLVRTRIKEALEKAQEKCTSQFNDVFKLDNASQILFCEKALMVEGKTEERIFPRLFEECTKATLVSNNCAFISLGGCGSLEGMRHVLDAMGIPHKSIVDLDFVIKTRLLDNKEAYLEKFKAKFLSLKEEHGIHITDNGFPSSKKGIVRASEAFAILAKEDDMLGVIEEIHEKLKDKNIWIWKKGDFEQHLNLSSKNEETWERFLNDLEEKGITELEVEHNDLVNVCEWIKN